MIVSVKWLREYVDISLSIEEIVHRLTMTGLEVDAVEERNPRIEGVITARVETVDKHPNADRLHICRVNDGEKTRRIVCGAPNVREGVIAPLALPGARMPGGAVIKEAKVRGEFSEGMLCSQKELQMGDESSGIWLLPEGTQIGVLLSDALGGPDTILDVSITPNRADCLSTIGIAREIAAICGVQLCYPSIALQESNPAIDSLASVTVDDPIACPRYAARLVQGVTIGPSPRWLRERLEAIGLRSINNIVDVTNFVLMELGQPLHAFDFDQLEERRIVVRRAEEGERFTTLDNVERTLFDDTLLICDGKKPVAIAGVMGGLNSEITPATRSVLIESACFQPQSIRRTSKKLGLRSEASYRFERGVDIEGAIRAADRAAQLMMEVGGGKLAAGIIDVYPTPCIMPALSLRVERTNRFLGTDFTSAQMANALRSIEMQVDDSNVETLRVVPPTFRQDVIREVDLTEEVARLIGYDNISVSYPKGATASPTHNPHLRMREEVREALKGFGLFEMVSYSFISLQSIQKLRLPEDDPRLRPVVVKNPISDEQGVMRTSLIPGLLQTAQYNIYRKNEDLKLFELSRAFLPPRDGALPDEQYHIAGIMAGRRFTQPLYGGDAEVDYTDVKGVVEQILEMFRLEGELTWKVEALPPFMDPWMAASVFYNGEILGAVGRVHPEVEAAFDLKKQAFLFELNFDKLFAQKKPRPLFTSLPKFPSVVRDMALVMDENAPVQGPLDLIGNEGVSFLEAAELFDLYRGSQFGQGKKSVGYRLVYRASDRSLTDEEVNAVHSDLVAKVMKAFGAELR
jgi:phenylalanyl-tRNA synthetase beta chain